MKKITLGLILLSTFVLGQNWQQKVDYKMDVNMDTENFRYDGKMDFTYYNNAPDQLNKLYFHLYYNAFQPGSLMSERLNHITDPDGRMIIENTDGTHTNKIENLAPEDQGYQKIKKIIQNGKELKYRILGTVMEVFLNQPLNPKSSVNLRMEWQAQVPQIVRRGGKNNENGIDLSMTQWYPKAAMYDESGWNLEEYIAREFYAPFGNFDVTIHIDPAYVIGASGKLQNPTQVKGYGASPKFKKNKKVDWHFVAKNIHDFAWVADPEFVVDTQKVPDGPQLYFVYNKNTPQSENWEKAQPILVSYYDFMKDNFGKYPWGTYTFAQGGDGGMEYGTITLTTGDRSLGSLIGTLIHEGSHSWFQQMYGTNETVDEWMDEGITSYASALAMNFLSKQNVKNPHQGAYQHYEGVVKAGIEEPMSLLADYYNTNSAYGMDAYSKGQILVAQLEYIIGKENLHKTFMEYYKQWKFRHPKARDFGKIAEDVSGMNLKWYFNLWINSTRTIDYGIENVNGKEITLKNYSDFPMPVDVLVEYTDGTKALYHIPLHAMREKKLMESFYYEDMPYHTLNYWGWTSPTYTFTTDKEVKKAEIDPTQRLADLNKDNNIYSK